MRKSIPATRVVHDFYELDPELGFYGEEVSMVDIHLPERP